MIFTMSGKQRPDDYGAARYFLPACLLAVLMAAAAGCASAPSYRTHPDLPQRTSTIRTVGLLPPMITMYEEQYKFGLNKVVLHDEWSPDAANAVRRAFIDETAAIRMPLTVIDGEDREANDLLDLFSVVDASIQRHSYEQESGALPPREPFPEKLRSFEYSLGPAGEMMERHQVDAVWIVTGFNLLPTTGARVADTVAVFIGILSAMGGGPGPLILKKTELRAALVDKNGAIVFYTKLDESNVPQAERKPGHYDAVQGERTIDQAAEEPVKKDMRDPRFARRYIRALLSEYQEAAR